jgi:hypothetical protein
MDHIMSIVADREGELHLVSPELAGICVNILYSV